MAIRILAWMTLAVAMSIGTQFARAADDDKKEDKKEEKDDSRKKIEATVKKLSDLTGKEQTQALAEIKKFLSDRSAKLDRDDVRLGFRTVMALRDEDNKLMAETALAMAKIMAGAKDPKVIGAALRFEGIARQTTLVGKEMKVRHKTIDGKDFDLNAWKGKVVLVDFWATWCPPCVAELPHVKEMYESYHSLGFEVVGISLDSEKEALDKFLEKKKLPWACILDDEGNDSLASYYGVLAIPTAIFIDKEGKVVTLSARGPELTSLLEKHLGKAPKKKDDKKKDDTKKDDTKKDDK